MSQAADFGFDEDAVMLRDSARRFFADNLPVDRLHALVAANPDPDQVQDCHWRPELWQQMVELGWTGLAIPESRGGLGMPSVAVAALVEESGRAAFPSPLLATLNCSYVLAACAGDGAQAALEQILAGKSASLAIMDQHGAWDSAGSDVVYNQGTLSGTACFVQDAQKADFLLVRARHSAGTGLYWLAREAAGVMVQPDAIVDLTRDQASVRFAGAAAIPVTDNAAAAMAQAMPAIWTMVSADMTGAAEWQLQTTADYARTRKQFDHALGFFQAIKHPLVNVMIAIDQTRSLVYNAACALDSEPERAAEYAHMAKASASDMASFASSRSVQFHGGIGFTWECFLHLYFKRQIHNQMLWGDAVYHRARMADILLGPIAA